MAQALTIAATAISAVGTLASSAMSAQSAKMSGNAWDESGEFQAKQLEQQAGQERASSQREAIERRRQATRAKSRVTALSAASGASASDPTVQNILAGLQAEGEYNALSALYEGDEAAKGLETSAEASRYEGSQMKSIWDYQARATKRSGYLSTAGTIASGGASFYDKYWPGEAD